MFTHFFYHLQKDARNKPLLVTLLLFCSLLLFSFIILKGTFSPFLIAWSLSYALAGFWLFWSGRPAILHGTLAVSLGMLVMSAVKLLTGSVAITPGIIILILLGAVLLMRRIFRTLSASPQVIFFVLLAGGILSTLSITYLANLR